jgi:hypothetical protein
MALKQPKLALVDGSPEKLSFYMNPEYWGGVVMKEQPIDPCPAQSLSLPDMFLAASALKKRFKEGSLIRSMPYRKGGVFKVEDYSHGTLAVFCRETLRPADNASPVSAMEGHTTDELPDPPTDLGSVLSYPARHPYATSGRDGLSYSYGVHIGVVVENALGEKFFSSVLANYIHRSPRGRLRIPLLRQVAESPEIEIGRTEHYGKKLDDFSERLTRINNLEVL